MTAERVERRLAAILAADVAGYSRLMNADEEGTHERLKAHFRQVIDPKIEEHRGRIVKNTGDGMLAEFSSAVNAMRCAAEIQRAMVERNTEFTPDRRIVFRVGINLGDIIVEANDIYGDGVNIAARLEALAEPGGVWISRTVREQILGKLNYPLEDMGEQSVKNIAAPVHAYAMNAAAVASLPIVVREPSIVSPRETSERADRSRPQLSIVVLPFVNLSNDPEQEYFTDGITDDLTTDLSRISGSFVIARNTAFTYKGKSVDVKQIGRELGVRYVLEGSVRQSGDQVRVNVQLIDAETGAHLWADRFDRNTEDLFALQDEITGRIAVALDSELVAAEVGRRTENPDAFDYILRGRASDAMPPTRDKYAQAIELFERALALDPRSVEAQNRLAIALVARVLDQMTSSAAADITRAKALVRQVSLAAPRHLLTHFAKGQILRVEKRYAEAIPEYETAIALNRNFINAFGILAECKLFTGSIGEMIPLQEQAIRLSPRDPHISIWYFRIGVAHLLQSRIDDAIIWLERARGANAALPYAHSHLASAYALKGETERAIIELAEARKLSGDGRYSNFARLKALQYWGVPNIEALYEATYFAGLRKAGMPEE